MMVCINGSKREVPQGVSLEELIQLYQLQKKSIVLELNRKVIERERFQATRLREDDTVEIVHFVGGG